MKRLYNVYIGLIAIAVVTSCAPSNPEFEVRQSTANFSKYIAVGNSLSAGFADGGLYLEGQRVAFPNLIAEKMQTVGGGTFVSPFFSEDQANGSGYIRLEDLVDGRPVTANVTDRLAVRGLNPQGGPLYTRYTGAEIHNLGVPGMRLDMAFAEGVGTQVGNPFFERLLPEDEPAATTYFGFTTNRSHTFFTFWLGNNDVLGYAMNGAVHAGPTTALTEVATFTFLYNRYIDELTTGGQKGAVATIPDVTAIPYFTTVTYEQILAGVQAVNSQVQHIFIETKQGPRAATSDDLFFLTFPTAELGQPNEGGIPFGLHPDNPIRDDLVLDSEEVQQVRTRVGQYNQVINQVASGKDLAVVNVYAFLNSVRNGLVYNGVPFSSAFISGNAFSLDGVHLTPMGNAVIANLFIEKINDRYNASIPKIDITQYSGVRMPR